MDGSVVRVRVSVSVRVRYRRASHLLGLGVGFHGCISVFLL